MVTNCNLVRQNQELACVET